MLEADDVIDLVRRVGIVFVKQAIFAAGLRAPGYERTQSGINFRRQSVTGGGLGLWP